jgi:hypothetical protein
LFACGHDQASVDIVGIGTAAVSPIGATAILSGDRSGTATVSLKREGDHWVVRRLESTLGKKTGNLPLVDGGSSPPAIEVEVEDGYWFGIAVGLVMLGSLLGGLALPFYGIGRRRKGLLNALQAALDRYEQVVEQAKASKEDVPVERPAGYPIADQRLPAVSGAPWRSGPDVSDRNFTLRR